MVVGHDRYISEVYIGHTRALAASLVYVIDCDIVPREYVATPMSRSSGDERRCCSVGYITDGGRRGGNRVIANS
eukprot:COSAG02_NODE_2149_length_9661_cov_2.215436_6_plen_74_part_00